MSSITAALISAAGSIVVGLLALVGVIITNSRSNRDIEKKIAVAQAVTDTRIDELTREVREHNCFARRMPVVEEQIRVANRRISKLENGIENIM